PSLRRPSTGRSSCATIQPRPWRASTWAICWRRPRSLTTWRAPNAVFAAVRTIDTVFSLTDGDMRNLPEPGLLGKSPTLPAKGPGASKEAFRAQSRQGAAMSDSLLGTDLYRLDDLLSDEQRLVRRSVRRLVEEEFLPIVQEHFRDATFPTEIAPRLGELGLFGMNLEGYGCPGTDNITYGLAMQELERG